jgi:hypothetical protein
MLIIPPNKKKEKGKDYNLLPSPKQPKSLQSILIVFFCSLPVKENYCHNIPQYLHFTTDLIF